MPTDPTRVDAAIRAADPAQPDTMRELVDALSTAELLVPIQPVPGQDASLLILRNDDVAYVPAYTTPEAAIGAVPEDVTLRRYPVRELAERWPEDVALALNAGSEPGGWLAGEGVRQLAGTGPDAGPTRPEATRVPAGTQVALGEPEEEPEALLQVIGRWLDEDGRVAAAYRGVMAQPGERPRWVIGVVPADDPDVAGDVDMPAGLVPIAEVAQELAVALADVTGGAQVDVLPVDPAAPDTVARWLLEQTQPFWRRADDDA